MVYTKFGESITGAHSCFAAVCSPESYCDLLMVLNTKLSCPFILRKSKVWPNFNNSAAIEYRTELQNRLRRQSHVVFPTALKYKRWDVKCCLFQWKRTKKCITFNSQMFALGKTHGSAQLNAKLCTPRNTVNYARAEDQLSEPQTNWRISATLTGRFHVREGVSRFVCVAVCYTITMCKHLSQDGFSLRNSC